MSESLDQERFSSVADFLSAITTRKENRHWENNRCSSQQEGNKDWTGTESFGEAIELARTGYNQPVERMKEELSTVTKRIFKRVEHCPALPKNDYVGSTPNVVRAMNGLPRDMRRNQRKEKKRNGITLVYEGGFHCGISTDEVVKAGSRMLSLLRLCEREQIPVRLMYSSSTTIRNKTISCEITAKNFHSVLNLNKMAFLLAHPSMERRLFMRWVETSGLPCRYDSGYGYPITNNSSDYEQCREEYAKQDKFWFCYRDFENDDDVLKAWNKITNNVTNS